MLKKITIALFILCPLLISAQNFTPIKELTKHEGEFVTVRDTFYGGKVLNDTTAIYNLGSLNPQEALTVIHCLTNGKNFGKQKRLIGRRNFDRITVTGNVFMVNNSPFIVVRNEKFIKFQVHIGVR